MNPNLDLWPVMEVLVHTKRKPAYGKGHFGNFATLPLPENTVVYQFKGVEVKHSKFLAHLKKFGLPENRFHDACFHRLKKTIYDKSGMTNQEELPLWYRTNHSNRPNLKVRFRNGFVQFVTLRDVQVGEELTIQYDGAEDWDPKPPLTEREQRMLRRKLEASKRELETSQREERTNKRKKNSRMSSN